MDGLGYSTLDVRIRAVQAVRNGMTVSQTATAFGVDRTTLHRWLARHKEDGDTGLQRKPVSGRPRVLPDITPKRLKRIVLAPAAKFGFETGVTGIPKRSSGKLVNNGGLGKSILGGFWGLRARPGPFDAPKEIYGDLA